MHLVIISCASRAIKNSNTAVVIEKFRKGYEQEGNTTEVHYLSEIAKWDDIKDAFKNSDNILFAIPLFVECIPGLMVEFIDSLEPKTYADCEPKTKISFLVQGGFMEASQLRCCETYLEKLPAYLNCEYNGTLIKGGMFATRFLGDKNEEKLTQPFVEMGKTFADDGCFEKEKVTEFAKPEFFDAKTEKMFKFEMPIDKVMFHMLMKKLGGKGSITAKPYKKYFE